MSRSDCGATTKHGEPCRSFTAPGSAYCLSHDPDRQADVRAGRAKGAAQANRLRAIRGQRSKLSTASELLSFTAGVIHDAREETLPPDIARTVLYGVSIQMRLIETSDLERRLAALEVQAAQSAERGARRW